jgi:hypothetical protein
MQDPKLRLGTSAVVVLRTNETEWSKWKMSRASKLDTPGILYLLPIPPPFVPSIMTTYTNPSSFGHPSPRAICQPVRRIDISFLSQTASTARSQGRSTASPRHKSCSNQTMAGQPPPHYSALPFCGLISRVLLRPKTVAKPQGRGSVSRAGRGHHGQSSESRILRLLFMDVEIFLV